MKKNFSNIFISLLITIGLPIPINIRFFERVREHAEKEGDISADELERAEKELEKVTHDHVEHIDAGLGRKEHELLEV